MATSSASRPVKVKPPRLSGPVGAASSSRHVHTKSKAAHTNGLVPIATASGEFARGAVIYLRLHNFLTFDDVEIHPGPHLNVIVGPNGTGKSSIVCAICLGLGGSPKLLGRAKDIKDFVKHNTDEGFVEIRLYELRDKGRSPIIKRVLSATTNTSTYYLNGKLVPQKEVRELVEKMSIQLDNHCQFLPQDMVVEFARMNMHQLLEETEKAIGPSEMYESHEKLKGMKSASADLGKALREKTRELEDEQRKNQLLERDVERFKNRQKYMSRIGYLKKKKLWVEYEAAREEWSRKKDARKKTALRLKELHKMNQPLREKRQKEEQKIAVLKEKAQGSNQKARRIENRVKSLRDKLQNLEEELEEPRQELERKQTEEANRKKRISDLKNEIQSFENSLKQLEPFDSVRRKIQEKNQRILIIRQQIDEIHTKQMDIGNESEQYRDTIRQAEGELSRMENVRTQRLDMLQRRDRDTLSAIQWLRDNQHLFHQPILEPVAISVNIKDRRYEAQVEAFLGGKDFHSFVAQNEEDRETFLKEIRDKKQWRVNIVRVPKRPLSEYHPEYSFHDLRRYGFQTMLIDLIEAPEPILRFFCEVQHLHEIPIAESLSPDQIERIKRELPKLRLFFTMNTRYLVKRSAYRNAASTRSSELMPARFLVASVDTQRKSELQRQIQEAQQSLVLYERQYKEYEEKDQALRRDDNTLRQEKNTLSKVLGSWKSTQSNIKSRRTKLESIQSQPPLDLEAAEKQCDEAVQEIQSKRVDCFRDLTSLMKSAGTATMESVEASLTVRSAEINVTYLQQEYEKTKGEQESAEQKLKECEYEERVSKERANAYLNKARRECGVQNPSENQQLMEMFNDFPNELERLDDMIHDLQAQAEMCMGTDENTVEEYERRERTIQRLTDEIEEIEGDLVGRQEKMAELKAKWLDPLKELLSGINDRFRSYFSEHTQMNCAGEVSLEENEDFAKYGIVIRVKFRNNEELQALNAQRQSGGERSVSTMLYLLALQDIASCPFRVVDEINQGMDPVNERHVFNLIVKSASRGAQYFLLTPKLLQNLEYSDAVMVHMVNNGQEMMSFTDWDMSKFLA